MAPKPREQRKTLFVRARLRTEQGWSDVTIANASSRGLMLQSPVPLRCNEFIEVRYRHVCIVGRIVWAGGSRCGVRTQDSVDVAAFVSRTPAKARKHGLERRTVMRATAPRAATAQALEGSRRFARVFDWAVVAIGGSAAAAFVAQVAYSALDAPLARVGAALVGTG